MNIRDILFIGILGLSGLLAIFRFSQIKNPSTQGDAKKRIQIFFNASIGIGVLAIALCFAGAHVPFNAVWFSFGIGLLMVSFFCWARICRDCRKNNMKLFD